MTLAKEKKRSSPATGRKAITADPEYQGIARQDLLGTQFLGKQEIVALLDRSDHYYKLLSTSEPFENSTLLQGRTVANLFFENSTRTRTSFELAEKRLGADFFSLSPAVSSLTKGESLHDTIRVLEAMKIDAVVVRHNASLVPQFIADRVPQHVHVINAGDGAHEHPTQALLDAATMRMAMGSLERKRIAIIGDIRHSRVARSNIWLLKNFGCEITLIAPETLLPRYAAEVFGVEVRTDLGDTLQRVDAVMALRIQHERQASGLFPTITEYHERYGLTTQRLAGSNAWLLHPGPINLGVELEEETAYGERSLVLPQVKRGVAVRMAVLEWLFTSPSA